jgi:drug/metabolite transporter (DMT)-like permease
MALLNACPPLPWDPFAYFLYFHLIRSVGPTSTATVTFLVPVFGLIWSIIFLQEPVSPGLFIGLALILTSVVLVTGLRLRPDRGTVESTDASQ